MAFIKARAFSALLVLWGALYLGLAMVPVSYWYTIGDVVFPEAVEGQPIFMDYSGGARRDFLGSYTVIGRNFATREIVCDARSGPFMYEVAAPRPDPLTMAWWAPSDPRCKSLPAGAYAIETCWTVHRPFLGVVPARVGCTSATLIVRAAPPDPERRKTP